MPHRAQVAVMSRRILAPADWQRLLNQVLRVMLRLQTEFKMAVNIRTKVQTPISISIQCLVQFGCFIPCIMAMRVLQDDNGIPHEHVFTYIPLPQPEEFDAD